LSKNDAQKPLPQGWVRGRLKDVLLTIEAGKSFTCEARPAEDDEWGVIKVSAMTWGSFRANENKAVPIGKEFDKRHEIRHGDILISRANTREYVGAPVLVGKCRPGLLLSDKSLRLVPGTEVDRRWLLYALSSPAFRRHISNAATGTKDSMRNISQQALLDAPLDIPPLAEQHRIVDLLDDHLSSLDAGFASLSHAKGLDTPLLRALHSFASDGSLYNSSLTSPGSFDIARRGIWRAARGEKPYKQPAAADLKMPISTPENWEIQSLEAVTDPVRIIRYGILMPRVKSAGMVPYVEVKDLKGCTLKDAVLHLTSPELDEQFAGARIYPGDVVIAVRGSYDRSAVVPTSLPGANLSRDVARLAPLPGLLPEFLQIFLQGVFAQRYLRRHARGVAVKGVNIAALRAMPIAIPPIAIQEVIISQSNELRDNFAKVGETIRVAEQRSRALRKAILTRAANGRLVPQDPSEELASALLARIAAERQSAAKPTRRTMNVATKQESAV
jgi:type I restriction enzyme S subunit